MLLIKPDQTTEFKYKIYTCNIDWKRQLYYIKETSYRPKIVDTFLKCTVLFVHRHELNRQGLIEEVNSGVAIKQGYCTLQLLDRT